MPLERHLVEVGHTEFNEPIIHCGHCHRPADYAQTVTERGEASYILTCPNPQPGGPVTLGSWASEHQRVQEIGAFIEARERTRNRA